jgi:hypothetical protein
MTILTRQNWPAIAVLAIIVVAVPFFATGTAARAGEYVIHNCPASQQPNYDAGPWHSWSSAALPSVGGFQSSCTPGSNSLGTAIGWYANQQALNSNLGVELISPSENITIRKVSLVWSVYHAASGSDTFAEVISDTGSELISPTPYATSTTNPATVYFPDGTRMIFVGDYCSYDASADCYFSSNTSPIIRLEGADTTLEDTAFPSATINGGSLTTSGPVSGKATLQFTAADNGSGARESELLLDGSPVITHSYANQCPYMDFAACPQSMSDSMTLNTSTIPNGEHRIAVRVTSASGNQQTVDDHAVLIANPSPSGSPSPGSSPTHTEEVTPPPCTATSGTHDSIAITALHRFVISNYRQRVNLRGELTGQGGTPIGNSSLEILTRPAVSGDDFSLLTHVTTRRDGRFAVSLPPGPSRTLCLRYKLLSGGLYAAALDVTHQVRAGLRLKLSPNHVAASGTVTLRGAVLGGFIPELGKVVELQVYYLGSWRVFRTLRTTSEGQFTSFYTFLGGRGSFAFRACVRAENNYPFVFGCSHAALIRAG